jgi:type IV secretion system protein VirB8
MNAMSKLIPYKILSLTDKAKEELFEQVGQLQAERVLLGRSALKAAWIIGGSGVAVGLAGMVCAATLFPLKTHTTDYFIVDQSTGYTGPSVGAKDAPTLFNEQTIQFWLRAYVELRENYVYETDDVAFHRVTIMSTPEEQMRYKVMHDNAMAPSRALRDKGYVRVDHFQIYKIGDGRQQTKEYVIKFDRWQMRSGQPVPIKPDAYTATVHFQFHPEFPMSLPDRQQNSAGLQVVAYQVDADAGALK